jgi:sulfur-carrier protein
VTVTAGGALVTVVLPGPLRSRAGNQTAVRVEGRTVREVIASLDCAFPGLGFNLCYETGEIRQYVNVFVDGEDVRFLRGIDTPTPAGTTIHVLPSVSGG